MANSLRISLIDDHGLRAAGVAAVLSEKCLRPGDDVVLVRTFGIASEIMNDRFVDLTPETDVCIYNVGGMPIHDPHVLTVVKHCLGALEGQPLILLSDQLDAVCVQTAIELGVRGVVPTEMKAEIAVAAIQFILAGGCYYPHSVSSPRGISSPGHPTGHSVIRPSDLNIQPKPQHLPYLDADAARLTDLQSGADPNVAFNFKDRQVRLTRRQYDVLMALEKGLTNKAIGRELDLSEATVKVHLRHLMRKLDATNRTQIALLVSSARNAAVPARSDTAISTHPRDQLSEDSYIRV